MKIGIDAKWFYNGPPSGKVVVQNLVQQLTKLNTKHEFYFFLDEKEKSRPFPNENANVHCVYLWAQNNLLSNLFVLPRLAKDLNLDAVFFQNFPSFSSSYKSIAYIHDVKFLSTPHFYTLKERLYFAPLRFLTRRADRACTVSEEEKKLLLKYRYKDNAHEIDVIHLGVDQVFQPRENYSHDYIEGIKAKFGLPAEFLLFVGRLNVIKNIYNLLKAIPLLKNKNIPIVIVGEANWKMFDHQKLIEDLDLKSRIVFTGFVQGRELACIYSLAKIFCFPSYAESFGLPPLEAMASGIPVIVSNRTSLPEICGDAGYYINPDKPDEIALAIDNLLVNPDLYAQKKQMGLARSKKFTWEQSAKNLIACIENCVNEKS